MEETKSTIISKQINRSNPLSHKETSNVIAIHYNNRVMVYDNIHYPKAYVAKLVHNPNDPIVAITYNGKNIEF